jgi:putative protease
MVSAQCVHRTTAGCDKTPGLIYLKDRKQKQFAVRNCCRYCFNVIYNSSPLYLLDCRKDWESYGLTAIRLTFTTETKEEMRQILDAGWAAVFQGEKVACPVSDYTRGHFRRGVE